MAVTRLRQSIDDAALQLLNQVDRDPYSRLRGCCDRRFWGWKLVDFPDATLQRTVQPLAWMLAHAPGHLPVPDDDVADAIVSGLLYCGEIQHGDGSFDQAYPQEHSVAGTAFLLDSAIAAYTVVGERCAASERTRILDTFQRAAAFLCRQDETHGVIANHVAGSILALLRAESLLQDGASGARADRLLQHLLDSQSREGWFPEYDGCDPGYLSLCVYYLAQVRTLRPSARLTEALTRAVTFLSHFIHPDGTFGGVYGSRRTAVYYPGGVAMLSAELPLAARMTTVMLRAADSRRLLGPGQPDAGNAVPVLASYQLALQHAQDDAGTIPDASLLPFERGGRADFPEAGLYVRSSSAVWAVVGTANGGTVSAWDRRTARRVCDDGGWVAESGSQRWTTQSTAAHPVEATDDSVQVTSGFRRMQQRIPTVPTMTALRLAGALLRWPAIGERVKRLLVHLLLRVGKPVEATVQRTVIISDRGIDVHDVLSGSRSFWAPLTRLSCGRPFSAIHMASAGYVVHRAQRPSVTEADLRVLAATGTYNVSSSTRVEHQDERPS
ncbi:MAG: hypothetical protein U0Q55_22315 [Vicinamibacterales bacterium]